MYQLFVGLIAEGNTDVRFLKNVIAHAMRDISWECNRDIEVFDIRIIRAAGPNFVEKMLAASSAASKQFGLSVLCIHADSDHRTIQSVLDNKFSPFFAELAHKDDAGYCKQIIPTIPIQMIESWMLADKELLKQLINASGMRDIDLGLERPPESYSDPKVAIENAISISMSHLPKKRRDSISISNLYETLGNRLSLNLLREIPSFVFFENNVRKAFQNLGLMR